MITGCEKGNVRGDVQYAAAQYTPVGCDAPDTAHLRDRCIHELIGVQALRTPAAIAIAGEMEQVSYRELARRAAALACRLRVLGVGPDVLVGLCVERSPAMIVGLLGILTAGGAYVPLDPSYPSDRLAFMLADARPAVLVTQRRLPAPSPELACPVIYLDDLDDAGGATPADDPAPAPHPDHLAYVIYTSGSTGRPKGVMISHRNLVHSTVARLRYYQEPVGRYLLLSSLSFDSSVAGIFWTLCQGGTLWIPPTAAVGDAAMLADCIANHCITHLLCVPSLYTHLLAAATPAHLQTLKVAIVAGEECPPSLVRLHHERIPGVQLFNEYGPTEGTVWSTVHACTPRSALGRVPIGRPIDGVQVYILDADRQPVPAGADGELAIGGAGRGRGDLPPPAGPAWRAAISTGRS